MAKKETIKVIGITKNDCITGLEYGLVEVEVFQEGEVTSPKDMTKKVKPMGPIKQTHTPIRQPALKWANKISAAKKRMMAAQKIKGK